MSRSLKGRISPNKDKKLSESHKKNISKNHNKFLSEETKKKIGLSKKGKHRTFSEEVKKRMSEGQRGKKVSEETKQRISQNNSKYWKGKHRSPETIKKISENNKGVSKNKGTKLSNETKEKLRRSHIGLIRSEETKKRMSESAKKRHNRQKHSEETKQKHKVLMLGDNNPNYGGLSDEHCNRISLSKRGHKMHPNTRKALIESYIKRFPTCKSNCQKVKERDEVRRTRQIQNGGFHTPTEWKKLKEKNNYTCLCCGRKEPDIKLTKDHIIPVSKGGTNNISNIQPLCNYCNVKKYTKTIRYPDVA